MDGAISEKHIPQAVQASVFAARGMSADRDGGNANALQLASAGRDWQHATDVMVMSSL